MSGIAIMAAIILAAVVLFVWNRLPVVIVAMGVAVALWATGLLTIDQALAGLGDPAVIFIASLFIVSAGLEMTGVTAWAGQLLIAHAGRESRTRLLIFTMLLVAGLTALISVNGAVAALLPVVVVMAVRPQALAVAAPDAIGVRGPFWIDACADRHPGQCAGFERGSRCRT